MTPFGPAQTIGKGKTSSNGVAARLHAQDADAGDVHDREAAWRGNVLRIDAGESQVGYDFRSARRGDAANLGIVLRDVAITAKREGVHDARGENMRVDDGPGMALPQLGAYHCRITSSQHVARQIRRKSSVERIAVGDLMVDASDGHIGMVLVAGIGMHPGKIVHEGARGAEVG